MYADATFLFVRAIADGHDGGCQLEDLGFHCRTGGGEKLLDMHRNPLATPSSCRLQYSHPRAQPQTRTRTRTRRHARARSASPLPRDGMCRCDWSAAAEPSPAEYVIRSCDSRPVDLLKLTARRGLIYTLRHIAWIQQVPQWSRIGVVHAKLRRRCGPLQSARLRRDGADDAAHWLQSSKLYSITLRLF